MAIKSGKDIYNVVEKHLRAAAYPMTVTMLMDIQEVHDTALEELSPSGDLREATNKLSDTLGFMWRRGLLTRFPAPKESNSFARFSYVWDQREDSRPVSDNPIARAMAGKTGFTVTEIDDGVLLEFQKFTVMIKAKP